MSWLDFFYFSKGERTGLIVLLSIVVIAVTILFINSQTRLADSQTLNEAPVNRNITEAPVTGDTPGTEQSISNEPAAETTPSPREAAPKASSPESKKETVSERVNRLTSYAQPTYTRVEKFAEGTLVELNTADTTTLKKIPGIGSAFAKRIVGYRALLGGYYSVTQLSEVYGIDEDRYEEFLPWFTVDPSLVRKLPVNTLPQDSLSRHPYVSYAQARVIMQLKRQKAKLTGWENLQLLSEFTESDRIRLKPYLSFE